MFEDKDMSKSISITDNNSFLRAIVAMTAGGDEVVLEENGTPVAKVIGLKATNVQRKTRTPHLGELKRRKLGLGSPDGYWMSDDFDAELPDEFWGFNKES